MTTPNTVAQGAPANPVPDPNDPAQQPQASFKPTKEMDFALSKAKVQLMQNPNFTFYSVMLLNMQMEWDPSVPTACTNGLFIKVGPDFFMKLNAPERLFILCHEVGHVAKNHMSRRGARTPKRWNKAGDYVINDELIQLGFTMPTGGLHDTKYRGMSTEEVYDLLPEDDPNDNSVDPWQDIQDADPNNVNTQHQIQQTIMQAAQAAQMRGQAGSIPGSVQVFLDALVKPKMKWNDILRKYTQERAKVDYSFSRPNRRFFPDFYLPGLDGEAFGAVEIAVDISGSVSDSDFSQFLAETRKIIEELHPTYVDFVQFDTSIHSVDRLESVDDLAKLEFHGRGGTDVTEVLERALQTKPKILLIFTDGEFYMPEGLSVKTDLVWLIHDNPRFTAPFGKVIHYKINS